MENDKTTAIEPTAATATVATQTTTAIEPTAATAIEPTAATAIEPTAATAIEPTAATVEARLDRIEELLSRSGPSNYAPLLFIIIACLVVFYLFDMNTFLMVMTTCLFIFGGV